MILAYFRGVYRTFTIDEKRNITIYIGGIMMYKVGLEIFVGSMTTLATDRFSARDAFTLLGAASGVNQAAQCIGAILIAPLVKQWPTKTVLTFAILIFALMSIILLVMDSATGGEIKPPNQRNSDYGSWNPDFIFLVWTIAGVAYGMVELIRRVLPAEIVGGHVGKLRRMDAMVHVFYEVAGTAGAFAASSAISRWGNNYSFLLTPIFFALAGAVWVFIDIARLQEDVPLSDVDADSKWNCNCYYFVQVGRGISHFVESVWLGTKLVLGNRRFIWLFPSYAVALYLHRFLENSLAPAFAKRVLGVSAWSPIIVGGSNFGELLGATSVFILSDYVTTPLPWLRLDALALNIVWVLAPLSLIAKAGDVSWAWRTGGLFIPISYSWAAGDVSLAAYIQASLSAREFGRKHISGLGAVMAFLYSSYIITNAILSSLLGEVIDKDFVRNGNIYTSLQQVGGLQYSTASVIILIATMVPLGAFRLNPEVIGDIPLRGDARATGEFKDEIPSSRVHRADNGDVESIESHENGERSLRIVYPQSSTLNVYPSSSASQYGYGVDNEYEDGGEVESEGGDGVLTVGAGAGASAGANEAIHTRRDPM